MAKPKKKKSFAAALKAARKPSRSSGVGLRYSEARDAYYMPIRQRTKKGKMAASKYDLMACSSGATAAMARGFAASPRMSCGPKGMGMSRSHRLLGFWRGIMRMKPGSLSAWKKNPPDGDVAYVYQANPEKGKAIEWGLIEPRTETVLITGTASTPEAGYAAAHKKARSVMLKANPEMKASGERVGSYKKTHVEMKSSGEWVQPRRGGKKKPTAKKISRKGSDALRRAMRGT